MTSQSRRALLGAAALLVTVLAFGCGKDSPGPGASTVSGNVSTATTGLDVSLRGITVIARGSGGETSDITDSAGGFILSGAPTGEISLTFRRGSCEAALAFGGVISSSTLTISNVSFNCPSGTATVSAGGVSEKFLGVVRGEPSSPDADMKVCTRVGSDDRSRHITPDGASVQDQGGQPTTFSDIQKRDLLEVQGDRSGPGNSFDFHVQNIRIQQRDTQDVCNDDPFV